VVRIVDSEKHANQYDFSFPAYLGSGKVDLLPGYGSWDWRANRWRGVGPSQSVSLSSGSEHRGAQRYVLLVWR